MRRLLVVLLLSCAIGGAQAQLYPLGTNVGAVQVPYNDGSGNWAALSLSGSGSICMSISCSMTTPNLGTPAAVNLANATNLPCSALPALSGAITTSAGSCVTSGGGSGLTSVGLSTTAGWLTVGNSPLTANGTITLNPTASQTANQFVATPNGAAGAVGLRAIVAADIPTLNQSTTGNAGTATALAATPSQCTGTQFATGVAASGNANCATPYGAPLATLTETAQTASIGTTTLCSSTVCNVAGGQYKVSWNMWGSGTACSSVTAGQVTLTLTWTDEQGTAHSGVIMLMQGQTTATAVSFNAYFHFETALANEGASGEFVLSTNGSSNISFSQVYTACTTGTGTYNTRIAVTRIQ